MMVLLDPAIRVTLLLVLTWVIAAAVERSGTSPATRHWVWIGGFAALAALPACSWLLPPLLVPVLPAEAPLAGAVPISAYGGPSAPTIDATGLLWTIYFAIAGVLLGRILLGRILLERAWNRAAPLDEPWSKRL